MKQLMIVAVVIFLAACGGADRDPEEHLLKSHQEALDRAQAVEDQVLEAAERRRREID